MPFLAPTNVRYTDGLLSWDAVPCADGYNVHSGLDYVLTTSNTSVEFPPGDEPLSVSAWVKSEQRELHTDRASVAADDVPRFGSRTGDILMHECFINDPELSPDSWTSAFPWGPDVVINNELQRYVDALHPEFEKSFNPFSFDAEGLRITARKIDGQWLSGKICTHRRIELSGDFHVEAKIRCDFMPGAWPAFWLLNAYYGGDEPEYDILEQPGFDPMQAFHTFHYMFANGDRPPQIQATSATDTREWHRYGLKRQDGAVIYLVDDVEVLRVTDNVSDQPMAVLLNVAIGGKWAGDPAEDAEEVSMQVEYVKAVRL